MSNKENVSDVHIDPMELALLGMKVSVGEDGRALRNGDPNAKYRLILRSPTRSGPSEPSERARNLKACKGLKGCEFAQCAKKAFGKLPKNLEGLCSIGRE